MIVYRHNPKRQFRKSVFSKHFSRLARVAEFARIPVLGMAKGPNFCKFGYERQPFAIRLKCYFFRNTLAKCSTA